MKKSVVVHSMFNVGFAQTDCMRGFSMMKQLLMFSNDGCNVVNFVGPTNYKDVMLLEHNIAAAIGIRF